MLPFLYLLAIVGSWIDTTRTGDDGVTCVLPLSGLPSDCLIDRVAPGSPAGVVGLRPGDVIAATDGDLFVSLDGVLRWYYHRSSGEAVTLKVRRATSGSVSPSADPINLPIVLGPRIQAPGIAINYPFWTLSGLVALVIAVVVIRARADDPAARLLFFFALAFASTSAIGAWQYAGRRDPPASAWYYLAFETATFLVVLLNLHLFLAFPVPQTLLLRLRALGPALLRPAGGGTFLLYLPVVVVFLTEPDNTPIVEFALLVVLEIFVIVVLGTGYRRAKTPLTRAQLRWPVFAFVIVAAASLLGALVPVATGQVLLPPSTSQVALGLVPLAIGIAILRYRLFDIDIVIRRTLLYGALTGSLGAIYIGSVVLLQALFRLLVGQGTDVAIVASTLAIAALFQPLRQRIQQVIDRRFYRQKYDAAQTLAAFSTALRDEVDLTQLSKRFTDVVEETMQPTRVALWLRPGNEKRKRTSAT